MEQHFPRHDEAKQGIGDTDPRNLPPGDESQHRSINRQQQKADIDDLKAVRLVPEMLFHHQISEQGGKRRPDLLEGDRAQVLERFKRDEEEHEAVQEGEAVGQVVRKMQAVPEKVGEIDGTAEAQGGEEPDIRHPPAQRDGFQGSKNRQQQDGEQSAIDIGQVPRPDGGSGAVEIPSEQAEHVEHGGQLRRLGPRGGGMPERQEHRHEQKHRQPARE